MSTTSSLTTSSSTSVATATAASHLMSTKFILKSCLKNKNTKSLKKVVWFDEVLIRDYPIILGDNPTTTTGIPITIDWIPQAESLHEFEYFELYRKPRKHNEELKLSSEQRVDLVIASGATVDNIVTTAMSMAQIQDERVQSAHKSHWELLKEGIDNRLHLHAKHFTKVPKEASKVLANWSHLSVLAQKQQQNQCTNAAA